MGWPVRTQKAIAIRLRRLGLRARARHGLETTTGGVAEILGCPVDRVSKWLLIRSIRRILEPRRIGTFYYIKRRAWRRLAMERPEVLGGFPADRLFLLLEDRDLADAVAAGHPLPLADRRIRCIETGQVWPSAVAAARDLHVSRTTITLAIRASRSVPSLGLTFETLRAADRNGLASSLAVVQLQT